MHIPVWYDHVRMLIILYFLKVAKGKIFRVNSQDFSKPSASVQAEGPYLFDLENSQRLCTEWLCLIYTGVDLAIKITCTSKRW